MTAPVQIGGEGLAGFDTNAEIERLMAHGYDWHNAYLSAQTAMHRFNTRHHLATHQGDSK